MTRSSRSVWLLFALGLGISLAMVARSQVAGDQLNLLARGWLLAEEGRFIPYGNPMSTGGKAPGGVTTLLVGLPLLLWKDHRAPTTVVLLFHVAAWLLLDRTLAPLLSRRGRLLLVMGYWLNPWRMYFSAFLWNPNYLFLLGAVHLWSCIRQRERPLFWPSFWHGAALALAFQIHASFLLLAVASLLLWWRRYFRIHWGGALAGGILCSLPLLPWALELAANPAIVSEADKGFPGRGLLLVFPLARGLLYWLRYASLALSEKFLLFDFQDLLGRDRWLGPGLTAAAKLLLPLTLAVPLLANLRLVRAHGGLLRRPPSPRGPGRNWLRGYALWCLGAAFVVFSLSPTTVMSWQGLIVLHAAVLPVVLWLEALSRTRIRRGVARGLRAFLAVEVVLLVALMLGGPHYRCKGHDPQGRDSFFFPLAHDHPMFHELGIQQTCPWPLSRPGKWWPDVL